MLIIVDKKIPAEAKEKLSGYGELLEFFTEELTYPAISCHPDLFFCKTPSELIVAPNLPETYYRILDEHGVRYERGNTKVGELVNRRVGESSLYRNKDKLHHSVYIHYNAAVSEEYLVHRLEYTDPVVLEHCHYLKKITVKQGYTRCNLLFLNKDHYITSDHGIHKALQQHQLTGILVTPDGIVLPGFPNGFIGGTMGILDNKIFILGSLDRYPDGKKVKDFLGETLIDVIELFNGPLYDGGSILFL
ncbi:MAG: hypothetical protein NTX61_05250 [Bacteroidetes bacterium]|nr:hypothetical protein [Bacteroidota bacterium]